MHEDRFYLGEMVSREGDDVWRITALLGDEAECACETPPAGWLRQDGSRGKAWCKPGDIARFLLIDLIPVQPVR